MAKDTELYDINAEFWLHQLYPEKDDSWQVNCKGTFYRNYSPDLLDMNEEEGTVKLSRESFVKLFPQGFITSNNELRSGNFKDKYQKLKRKEQLLKELFQPVDNVFFRSRLHIERKVSSLWHQALPEILKAYYGYDLYREQSPLVRKIAPLLLHISHLRANFGWIREVLSLLFDCEVEMVRTRTTWSEWDDDSQPTVRYNLYLSNLDAESYKEKANQLKPLKEFLQEWFIPFDTNCIIEIKQRAEDMQLQASSLLNYNIAMPNETRVEAEISND